MLTTSQIQSYGASHYESYSIKIPSEVVQKEEEREQQPAVDGNTLVNSKFSSRGKQKGQ